MKVDFLDLKRQYQSIKPEIDQAIAQVIDSTAFSGGPFVEEFESAFGQAHEVEYCVGVNSGTAALHLALWALDVKAGDEVIVPANTFFATAEAVSLTGAKPVFIDCEEKYYNIDPGLIEEAITSDTKAIIPVHLYGHPAEMQKIGELAERHNVAVIEDCAQAHLASISGRMVGTFGRMGCFSFYPGKNLGAFGEGGCIVTNDPGLYHKLMMLRNHGSETKYHHDFIGHNYRMEGLQGAVLNVKLEYLAQWTKQRNCAAELYRQHLSDIEQVQLPLQRKNIKHSYHLFVIRVPDRARLISFLNNHGISVGIHYPIPCHLQKAYAPLGYDKGSFERSETLSDQVLSLPMHEGISSEEIAYVARKIKEFYLA